MSRFLNSALFFEDADANGVGADNGSDAASKVGVGGARRRGSSGPSALADAQLGSAATEQEAVYKKVASAKMGAAVERNIRSRKLSASHTVNTVSSRPAKLRQRPMRAAVPPLHSSISPLSKTHLHVFSEKGHTRFVEQLSKWLAERSGLEFVYCEEECQWQVQAYSELNVPTRFHAQLYRKTTNKNVSDLLLETNRVSGCRLLFRTLFQELKTCLQRSGFVTVGEQEDQTKSENILDMGMTDGIDIGAAKPCRLQRQKAFSPFSNLPGPAAGLGFLGDDDFDLSASVDNESDEETKTDPLCPSVVLLRQVSSEFFETKVQGLQRMVALSTDVETRSILRRNAALIDLLVVCARDSHSEVSRCALAVLSNICDEEDICKTLAANGATDKLMHTLSTSALSPIAAEEKQATKQININSASNRLHSSPLHAKEIRSKCAILLQKLSPFL